jgi:hypothetical protein
MSELIQAGDLNVRRNLLATASALALAGYIASVDLANAQDGDHPTVWISLGVQADKISGEGHSFKPDFMSAYSDSPVITPALLDMQMLPSWNVGGDGSISIQPDGSDWKFTASVRFGRSGGHKRFVKQVNDPDVLDVKKRVVRRNGHRYVYPTYVYVHTRYPRFSQTDADPKQTHAIMDFQVGKDVGLGMFGRGASSTFDVGVRFAQFTSRKNVTMHVEPAVTLFNVWDGINPPPYYYAGWHQHLYTAAANSTRTFHGVGPSISWNGSTPFAGSPESSELTFDWGVNAAILFGRQKVKGAHQVTGRYRKYGGAPTTVYHYTVPFARARSIVVPNLGGFAGVSFRYADAKVSFGYRGDFFFGAIDTGDASRKRETLGFHGPFATVSIGLGG